MRLPSLTLLASLGVTGCFPIAAHPTRVESGPRAGVAQTFALLSDSTAECGERLLIVSAVDVELSLGIRDTSRSTGPGFRLGGIFGMNGQGLTAYGELPREWFGDLDAGIGFAVHGGVRSLRTAYVQAGAPIRPGRHWFVRFGLARLRPDVDSAGTARLWIPVAGVSVSRGSTEGVLFAAGVVGPQPWTERACFLAGRPGPGHGPSWDWR